MKNQTDARTKSTVNRRPSNSRGFLIQSENS